MFDQSRNTGAGAALALTAVLTWGAMFPIAAHALPHVEALHLTAARYLLAVPFFVGLLLVVEGATALRTEGRSLRLWIHGTVGFAGFNLLSYIGLAHTGPRNAALMVATMPLLTVGYRRLRDGVRPAPGAIAAAVAALAGVLLVLSGGDLSTLGDGGVGWGAGLVLLGVAGWVVYTVGADRFAGWSPLRYTAMSATAGTLSIVAITEAASAAGWVDRPGAADWAAIVPELAFVVLLGAVTAVIAWNAAMRRLGPARGVLFINLVPLTSFAISIAEGYRPNAYEVGGAALTIAALVAANLAGRRAPGPTAVSRRRRGGPAGRSGQLARRRDEAPRHQPA